jgi:hypothetical protein
MPDIEAHRVGPVVSAGGGVIAATADLDEQQAV